MTTENNLPVSYGYERISLAKAKKLSRTWLNKSLPSSQWQLVEPILRKKKVPSLAIPVIKIIKKLNLKRTKLLDVGCSSGYYYDFFKWANLNVKYAGCDISPEFISLSRKKHWGVDFKIAPITKLPYKDNNFDLVFASGILHYELNYRQALKEMARVSSRYILLHRLPIFISNTRISYYQKIGYGIKMMETIYPLYKLTHLFDDLGLIMKFYLWGDKLDIKTSAHWMTILLDKQLSRPVATRAKV